MGRIFRQRHMTLRPGWGRLGRVKGDAHYPDAGRRKPAAAIRTCLLALACAALAACAGGGGVRGAGSEAYGLGDEGYAEATPLSLRSNEVLMRAIGLVGTPYRYGGNTPEGGFDCSGLVGFVFRDAAGVALPRSTRELIDIPAPSIPRAALQPGDLVYFNPSGGRVSHIGIYVGEGRFVHAPSRGGTVRLDALGSDYWNRYFVGAKRVLQ
jgi:cell wall-associated NlpC family hydrolase